MPPRPPTVDEFLRTCDHPLLGNIEDVRRIVLGASPEIGEGVKWNAPSFRTTEWFATFNLRARDRVQLIFHMGAKVRDGTTKGSWLADPAGLCEWLSPDRCLVTLGSGKQIRANRAAFEAIVRAWIAKASAVWAAPPAGTPPSRRRK